MLRNRHMKDCRYCTIHSYCWQQQGVSSQIFDPAALSQRHVSQGTGNWVGPRHVIERVEQRKLTLPLSGNELETPGYLAYTLIIILSILVSPVWKSLFLGAFAKLRKVAITVMSTWNSTVPTGRIFKKFSMDFSKICPKNASFIKIRQ